MEKYMLRGKDKMMLEHIVSKYGKNDVRRKIDEMSVYRKLKEPIPMVGDKDGGLDELELHVSYTKKDYYNDGGFYVNVHPIGRVDKGSYVMMRRIILGDQRESGFRVLALPATRNNAKKRDAIEAYLDQFMDEFAELYYEGRYAKLANTIVNLVREKFAK